MHLATEVFLNSFKKYLLIDLSNLNTCVFSMTVIIFFPILCGLQDQVTFFFPAFFSSVRAWGKLAFCGVEPNAERSSTEDSGVTVQ